MTSQLKGSSRSSSNQLQSLLGHYNSEDEEEDSGDESEMRNGEHDGESLDGQFQDFMKEIKEMEPTAPEATADNPVSSDWQELWDPQSGFPYYWNTKTNELTWDRPSAFSTTKKEKPESLGKPVDKKESYPAAPAPSQQLTTDPQPRPAVNEASKKNEPQPAKPTLEENTDDSRSQTYDVDFIIAEIEREVPPDVVANGKDANGKDAFVPLFKRRKFTDKPEVGPKLNFKNYFSASSLPLFTGDDEREAFAFEQPADLVNTKKAPHFGIGYSDNEATQSSKASAEINFIKGDTLQPMVAEVVTKSEVKSFQENLEEFQAMLKEKGEAAEVPEHVKIAVQLEALLEAQKEGSLPESYVEKWIEAERGRLDAVKPEEDVEAPESPKERLGDNLQVENMDLAESDDENQQKAKEEEKTPDIDSALSSFYSDLATLEA